MTRIGSYLAAGALGLMTATSASADVGGAVDIGVIRTINGWAVMSGSSLKETLDGWCREAGWSLIWDNPNDYTLGASASFPGGFEEAVGQLIDSIYINNPTITATLYQGNRVLRIEGNPLSSN